MSWYLADPNGKSWRMMGWAFLITFALLLGLSGKAYYLLGVYPMLFAAGAVAIESWADKWARKWLPAALIVGMILFGIPFLPYALPILPIEKAEQYFGVMADKLGLRGPLRWEDASYHRLTQDFADMHGWDEMVKKVAAAYQSLNPEEQERCLVRAWGYYNAGAINRLGDAYGLPDAVCLDASFLFWAPEEIHEDIFIYAARGFEQEQMKAYWGTIEQFGEVQNDFAREKGTGIFICQDPVGDWKADWKSAIQQLKAEKSSVNDYSTLIYWASRLIR